MLTILRETYPTANKEHRCEFCFGKITIGQKYVRQTNVYDGVVDDFITHKECKEVADELRMYDDCDEGLDGDGLWNLLCYCRIIMYRFQSKSQKTVHRRCSDMRLNVWRSD